MAFRKQTNETNATNAANAATAFNEGVAETIENTEEFYSVFDFDNTSSLLGGSNGDLVNKLMTNVDEEIEKISQRHKVVEFKALPLDREVNQVHASSVVLTAVDREYPRAGIMVHVMIIEATSPQEDPITINIPGHGHQASRTISVPVMTSSVWDDDYLSEVNKVINQANNLDPSNQPVIVGVTVLPRSFDFDDKEAFAKMIRNVSMSLMTEVAKNRQVSKLVLGKPAEGKYISAKIDYSSRHIKDSVGLPQRSDILIQLSENSVRTGQNRTSLNGKLRAKREMGQLSGYIDFFWNPVAPVQTNSFGNFGVQQAPTQKYSPVMVVRSLKTPVTGVIEAQLLMLMCAGTVSKQNEWINSLLANWSESRREENKNRLNFRDVGALNIEANLPIAGVPTTTKYGAPINTIEDSFTQESFVQYLGSVVRPELHYAVDMPILGAESWYMDRFMASTQNDKDGEEEVAAIAKILDDMTGNHFSREFEKLGGGQLWLGTPVPYHTGYYYGDRDEMRDLADIDLLAVLNRLGTTDPTVGERWANTWVPNTDNTDMLLDERLSIITDVLGGKNYVLTGWGLRSFINPMVIIALGRAAHENGFKMSYTSPYSNNLQSTTRAQFDFGGVAGARANNFDGIFQSRSSVVANNSSDTFAGFTTGRFR